MKNKYRPPLVVLLIAISLLMSSAYQTRAAGPKVSELGNKHNLSASNTGVTYYATDDSINNPKGRQICVFCHTPHNANVAGQAPLWNRSFSNEIFQRYTSATLRIRGILDSQYAAGAQPNGSSKLCLSCHDGVSKLGAVYDGAPITMNVDIIAGRSSFKPDTEKMKYGHHPVSFVYSPAVVSAINTAKVTTTYQSPLLTQVKLDKQNRMQCTTCHDAHQNQSVENECYVSPTCVSPNNRKKAPFWVYGLTGTAANDQQAVCLTCHPMDASAGFTFSSPWPTP